VLADRVTGSKTVTRRTVRRPVQGGNVRLVAGPWVNDFREEAEAYPNSRFLDQIDAAAMAFAHLAKRAGYDLEIWRRAFE